MTRYALILPLILLSFLLGYFASNSQREYAYVIAILTAVFVTSAGYLLFVKPKSGERKQVKRATTSMLAALFLFSAVTGPWLIKSAEANPVPLYYLTMPEEYINYTVCWVNGSLWAKVDGTYPLNKVNVECQDGMDSNSWFTFSGDTLPLVYPTPPGTTAISLKVDETELEWGNYTQAVPEAVHYTAVGDWPMISCMVYPVLDQFTLKIHYEHPIMQSNGSYTFLYDLNISPYLSPWSNKSTAHFNITFETAITDLQARTIATDGALNPVEYTVTREAEAETVSLQVVSEYSQPLPGDLLISFHEDNESGQPNSGFLGSTEQCYVLVAVIAIAVVAIVGYLLLKHKKGGDNK